MNILVTGANGQLGNEMRLVAQTSKDTYIFTDVNQVEGLETTYLDITDREAVLQMVKENNVNAIVNCAAYTNEDLDWMDKKSRTTLEMADKSSRPEIKNKIENINEYHKIIIGFPVWWYTAPTIINTFIEENDLTGKEIYIFVTSGGSSFGGSLKDLRNTYPHLNFINGIRLTGNERDNELTTWLN